MFFHSVPSLKNKQKKNLSQAQPAVRPTKPKPATCEEDLPKVRYRTKEKAKTEEQVRDKFLPHKKKINKQKKPDTCQLLNTFSTIETLQGQFCS